MCSICALLLGKMHKFHFSLHTLQRTNRAETTTANKEKQEHTSPSPYVNVTARMVHTHTPNTLAHTHAIALTLSTLCLYVEICEISA